MPSNDFDRCKQGTTVQGTLLLHYQTRKILVQQLQTSKKAKEAYLLCLGWGMRQNEDGSNFIQCDCVSCVYLSPNHTHAQAHDCSNGD